MSEEGFWRSNPKKIGSLWELHGRFMGWEIKEKSEETTTYVNIDEVLFI